MRQAVLLGNAGTKRTDYFMQAAEQLGLPVCFVDWQDYEQWKTRWNQSSQLLKIDPPLWNSCALGELEQLAADYKQKLFELSALAKGHPVEFFNDPLVIAQLLDKRVCKRRLQQVGLPVTDLLEDNREQIQEQETVYLPEQKKADRKLTASQLVELMYQKKVYQVFIKPVNGSGAAGVFALRVQPSAGRMALYTCALAHPEYGLVNTKFLRHFSRPREIFPLLDQILKLDCVIERWYAKAEYQGYSYDLRAVVLDGRMEFLLGRLSKGPITNLHLNNRPLEAATLGLSDHTLEKIALLCKRAAACFPGLRCAGIDLLLEKGSLRPRVIEMNAQGDLIYQDIFHENRIYRREAKMMQK